MAASSLSSAQSKVERPPKRLGSTVPRVFTPPIAAGRPGPCGCGCSLSAETSLGFAVETFAEEVLEMTLLPWERWFLIHALELLADGSFRFRTIVLLVARQNGKSTVLQILSLWMMYVFGTKLVIGTAQNLDVAEEQWAAAVELAEDIPELAEEIAQKSLVNGKKFLRLETGERYKVAAASRRGGRGLSGDLVLLDELREHQTWDAWAAVTKTTMARALALIVGASNAGDDSSIVLRHLRLQCHAALGDPDGVIAASETYVTDPDHDAPDFDLDADDLGLFEWSAPPGCDIWDRDGWAQANPALGFTITERAIASAARTDPDWVFRTEVLCQWIDGTTEGPFPPGSWEASEDLDSAIAPDSRIVTCVDVSWDRSTAHIAAAGWRTDGLPHVEVIASRAGTDWVTGWYTDPNHPERSSYPVAVQTSRSPASTLVESLNDAHLDVLEWHGADIPAACGDFYDRVRQAIGEGDSDTGLRHLRQPVLDVAASNAATKPSGDAWFWDRKKSSVDIAPLVAATGALWGLTTKDPPRSAYEDSDLIIA